MGLSRNDSQAFAPDGAIVFVTSTLNCNLVMCQAGESIIHSISAGERRLKVQDMPQVIKVVKIRRYTMGGKNRHSSFSSILSLSQKMCLSKKKKKITGCRKATILNSNAKITLLFEFLKPLCYQLHFSWKEAERLLLKSVSKLQDSRTQLHDFSLIAIFTSTVTYL